MEYFYMFSEGSYSDYTVGGLYKSNTKISPEQFKQYRKEMLTHLLESAGLPVEDHLNLIEETYSEYSLKEAIYEVVGPPQPPSPYSYARNMNVGPVRLDRMKKEYSEWCEKKYEFFRKSNLIFSTVDYLVDKGILEPVEYEEVHEIDG